MEYNDIINISLLSFVLGVHTHTHTRARVGRVSLSQTNGTSFPMKRMCEMKAQTPNVCAFYTRFISKCQQQQHSKFLH